LELGLVRIPQPIDLCPLCRKHKDTRARTDPREAVSKADPPIRPLVVADKGRVSRFISGMAGGRAGGIPPVETGIALAIVIGVIMMHRLTEAERKRWI
jgi:hypothetical protein